MIISNFKYLHGNYVLAFLLDLGSNVALFCHVVSVTNLCISRRI